MTNDAEPSDVQLSEAWQDWVVENALEGATVEELVDGVVEKGASRDIVLAEVLAICASAPMRAARAWRREALRLKKVNSLRLALHRGHGSKEVERRAGLAPEHLYADYLRHMQPVVLTDVADRWPAVLEWSAEHLSSRLGDLPVQVCIGREAVRDPDAAYDRFTQTVPFNEFARRVVEAGETNDLYLIGNHKIFDLPKAKVLLDDIGPSIEAYLEGGKRAAATRFWFGPAGTITHLHFDAVSLLYAQVCGRKRFRLVSPNCAALLLTAKGFYATLSPEEGAERSGDRVYEVVLQPGELLMLPAGWWHEVTALDVSVSLVFTNLPGPTSFPWYRPGFLGDEQTTWGQGPQATS